MKKLLIILFAMIILIGFGCAQQPVKKPEVKPKVSESYPMTVTDSTGRKVTIKSKPKRVISLAPSNTEILFALNAGKSVVGDTTYCDYPKAAKNITKVGGFTDPNVEKIVELKPDIVFGSGTLQSEFVSKLESLEIPVFLVDTKSLTEVMQNVETMGTILDKMPEAVVVTGKMRAKINDIESKLHNTKDRPLVFYEVYNEPLITAGPKTFVNDLITRAKGKNAGAAVKAEYPQFSLEKLIEMNPDVYIAVEGTNWKPGNIKTRPGWDKIDAVVNDKISIVNDDLVSRPGPRIIYGFEQIAKAIHPEVFK